MRNTTAMGVVKSREDESLTLFDFYFPIHPSICNGIWILYLPPVISQEHLILP